MAGLDLTARLTADPTMVFGTIDGDLVAMNVDRGSYFHFNGMAGRILELLGQPQSLASICDQLTREYRVERDECEREVLAFATALVERGVLRTRE